MVRSRRSGRRRAKTCRTPRCTGCRRCVRTVARTSPPVGNLAGRRVVLLHRFNERKAKNLAQNPHCILTTGCNRLDDGLDLVVEGEAAKVSDGAELRSVADTYESSMVGISPLPGAPGSVSVTPLGAVKPWCTGSLPRQPSVSPKAGSSARLGGVSPDSSGGSWPNGRGRRQHRCPRQVPRAGGRPARTAGRGSKGARHQRSCAFSTLRDRQGCPCPRSHHRCWNPYGSSSPRNCPSAASSILITRWAVTGVASPTGWSSNPNRQIRSLVLYVHGVRLSAVGAAQVGCRIQLDRLSVVW